MDIEHRIEEAQRRVFMTVGETATGAAVARRIAELAVTRPELAGWDWVQDVRQSRGEVDNADIAAVAEAFAAAPAGPCWTVFVSHDPNLAIWCKVMDAMFNGRLHRSAPTPEAAVQLLEILRPTRAPSSS